MLKLIQNEWMKLWSKKGTWVMAILLSAIIVGITGLAKLTENLADSDIWIDGMKEEIAEVEEQLASPDLAEDEKADLEMQKADLEEAIVYSIESSKPLTRESYIADSFGLMPIVTLLVIIVAAGIVPAEFSQGTIKMLLSRPVSRWKVLTSKYVTVLLFGLFATMVLYGSAVLSAFIFFPGATESTIAFYEKDIAVSAAWGKSLYMLFLGFINTVVISTIAFMLGTVFRSTSLAIGISMFLYFTGGMIVMFMSEYAIAKYLIFANMNLTQYETDYLMLDDLTMPFSIGVIVVYMIVFLVLSFLSFMKRDVTA